jgi:hypothetical protein
MSCAFCDYALYTGGPVLSQQDVAGVAGTFEVHYSPAPDSLENGQVTSAFRHLGGASLGRGGACNPFILKGDCHAIGHRTGAAARCAGRPHRGGDGEWAVVIRRSQNVPSRDIMGRPRANSAQTPEKNPEQISPAGASHVTAPRLGATAMQEAAGGWTPAASNDGWLPRWIGVRTRTRVLVPPVAPPPSGSFRPVERTGTH